MAHVNHRQIFEDEAQTFSFRISGLPHKLIYVPEATMQTAVSQSFTFENAGFIGPEGPMNFIKVGPERVFSVSFMNLSCLFS